MSFILWNKKYGETLVETLNRFRNEYPQYKNEKITYAGRLDPLACGVLLLLTGKDVFKKDKYLRLPKTYTMNFVLGFETDTGDILGKLEKKYENISFPVNPDFSFLLGQYEQEYPKFSSKTVNGKPLWVWARENKLSEIIIPTKKIEIFSIESLFVEKMTKTKLHKKIISSLEIVNGDFRQKEIIDTWNIFFNNSQEKYFFVCKIEASVSSGTYMRSIAKRIGEKFSCGAVSLKIERTHIGNFSF